MSRSKGTFKNLRFCPWCGTESVHRDQRPIESKKGKNDHICTVCGRGFSVGPSLRHQQANEYFKLHRQMRPYEKPQGGKRDE